MANTRAAHQARTRRYTAAPATGGPQRAAGTGTEHLTGRRHERRLGRRQGTAGRRATCTALRCRASASGCTSSGTARCAWTATRRARCSRSTSSPRPAPTSSRSARRSARAGATYLARTTGTPDRPRRGAHRRRRRRRRCESHRPHRRQQRPAGALLRHLHLVAGAARRRCRPGPRRDWEREAEAEAGFFGRALLEGDAVIGWMHVAPSRLTPRARCLPAGPPLPDAYLLTCSYFYDEEYLHGFQFLLQEIEASLKHRKVAALEAFGLRHARGRRRLSRLHPRTEPLQSGRARGRRLPAGAGEGRRGAVPAGPRRPGRGAAAQPAWEHVEAPAGAQPVC